MRGIITDRSIRALKNGQIRMSSRLTGFGVRKTHGGKVRFFVRRVVGPKDIRKTIGKYPALSPQQARKLAERELTALEEQPTRCEDGRTQAGETERTHTDSRIEQLLRANALLLEQVRELVDAQKHVTASPMLHAFVQARFVPQWTLLSKCAQRNYFGIYERKIRGVFGEKAVHTITPATIEPWFLAMAATPRTANTAKAMLLRFLRLAHRDGHIREVPRLQVRDFKTGTREGLSTRQLAKLMTHLQRLLRTQPSMHLRAIITILNTGERRESCVALRVDEVDFERQLITRVRKGGRVEPLPITDFATQWLEMIKPKVGGYFFPSKYSATGHINGRTLLDWLKRECKKIGVLTNDGKPPCIHSLRHTWASTLARNGVTIAHIQKLLGHSSMKTTFRYITGDRDAARKAASTVTETRVDLAGAVEQVGHSRNKMYEHQNCTRVIDPQMRLTGEDAERLILPVVRRHGGANMRTLQEATGIPDRKLRSHVCLLVRSGKLVRHGHATSSYYTIGKIRGVPEPT